HHPSAGGDIDDIPVRISVDQSEEASTAAGSTKSRDLPRHPHRSGKRRDDGMLHRRLEFGDGERAILRGAEGHITPPSVIFLMSSAASSSSSDISPCSSTSSRTDRPVATASLAILAPAS